MKKSSLFVRFTSYCGFAGLMSLSSLVKFSWIIGSQMAFFSGINIVAPLSGAFGGIFGSTASFLLRIITYACLFGTLSVKTFTLGIPSFFASLYWASNHWLVRAGIPLLCMTLFWLHPVGFAAGAYALYWIIPVMVHFLSRKYLLLEALGSTFVAHAVGSVIWLYATPMTANVWRALIPVVAVERLLFAAGMVVVHYGISLTMHYFHSRHAAGIKDPYMPLREALQ
jgi:hypothetical protein